MSSEYWTSKESEQRAYGIPNGWLWRIYEDLYRGKTSRILIADRIREGLTVERVFSRFSVKASKSSSYWKINCPSPDHDDKHPSCVVWPGIKGFKCYSCGVSGDLVELYRLLKISSRGELHGKPTRG